MAQKSGKVSGQAQKYEKIMDNYINSATCLSTMASEILKLPDVEVATPFDGKISRNEQKCISKIMSMVFH